METSSACPHHGFDTWMLVNHFYDGMSPPMKQLVETMCGGNFLSKHPDEAIDFLNYIAETSKAWDEPRPREDEGPRYSSYKGDSIHTISEDTLMREKLTILTRRLDEMEMKNQHNIHSVNEFSASQPSCYNYQSHGHYGENCQENVQILNQGRPPMNVPFGNSYIQNWKNHSNLLGKPYIPPTGQQQFAPTSQQQQPLPLSPVEQAVLNLSKVVGTIVEEQKVLNDQTNQRIEAAESSVNRNLSNMHAEILKLSNQQLQNSEKEKGPFQGQQYQNMVNEIGLTEDTTTRTDEVKEVVTLRSGRELRTAVPELIKSAPVVAEPLQEEQTSALISEEESQEEECLSDTMVEEQCQQHLLLEPSDIGATVCLWENHTALLSEEGSGKEIVEDPQQHVLQPIPTNPTANAKTTCTTAHTCNKIKTSSTSSQS